MGANCPTASVAVDDLSRDGVGTAQHSSDLVEIARHDRVASARARVGSARVARDLGHMHDEAAVSTDLSEQGQIARALHPGGDHGLGLFLGVLRIDGV